MKRKKIKTILCHMAIITICAGVFCHGYINGISISGNDWIYSYAEADNWSACDSSDLVTAFRYYCKSRNLALEGSAADALTTFTTTTFNNICSTLGIDPTSLQAELKKTTQGNLGLRFLFSNTGITAYNRIFAEFLQNNNLAVGDEVNNTVLKSGKYFKDKNGNGCWIYVTTKNYSSSSSFGNSDFSKIGSQYIYSYSDLKPICASSQTKYFYLTEDYTLQVDFSPGTSTGYFGKYYTVNGNLGSNSVKRIPILSSSENDLWWMGICLTPNGKMYVGFDPKVNNLHNFYPIAELTSDSENTTTEDIYITTNNNTINNNTYNNNYTIIYNEGDIYISDDDEPLPTTPPPGGGGDNPGGDPGGGGEPDNWDPTTPNIPEPSSPEFPSVNLPDIDIPDLPSLNFSLGDLREKFPFSLPFDIIAVLNVLDGEPQAPHIEATVPIGKWYTWEMDFDFSEFDNYARIFRAFEFIGFCIGLAVFTVHFVKG